MFILLENIECFAPLYLGKKDILIVKDTIYKVAPPQTLKNRFNFLKVIDGSKLTAFPGIVDSHVHIVGGGGESGPSSRIEEISAKEIIAAGITTVAGLLGADRHTKTLKMLHAKAKSLENSGISTYIYSGSYEVPAVTFTGDLTSDLILIDKVIGVGEIAISDLRSSHADIGALLALSSAVYMGGLLSGKAGLVHLHLGDGKKGLEILNEMLERSDLPKSTFLPTHINRNKALFCQGIEYIINGGNIDLTAGEEIGHTVPDAISILLKEKLNMSQVTISSDGNASTPQGGVCKIGKLYEDLKKLIQNVCEPSQALSLVTKNPAERLKLYPKKGSITEGCDADIVITDKNFNIEKVFSMGKLIYNKDEYFRES